jgi:endonuclease I
MIRTTFTLCLALWGFFLQATIPTGYYNAAEGKSAAALKTSLHQIIANDTTGYLSYGSGSGSTWQGFYYADRIAATNQVIDMYSSVVRYFNGFNSVSGMNIEHSLPKSWWGGSTGVAAYRELHHLCPSDANANTAKSNHPLGVVTATPSFNNDVSKVGYSTYLGYNGTVFEPANEYKGDFARIYFYMATAYQNYSGSWNYGYMLNNNTYPVLNTYAQSLLLEWHRQDPVSAKETARNEAVFGIQNNRNPYVDYPELAEHVWGNKSTVPFSSTASPGSTAVINAVVNQLTSNATMNFSTKNNAPVQKSIRIKGDDLQAGITMVLSGTNAALFSVTKSSLSQSAASVGEEITITYSPVSAGTHTAVLTINSLNASPFVINLSGNQ